MRMSKNTLRAACSIVLLASWLVTVACMITDATRDSGPTGLPGDLPNWHNRPGELRLYIALSAAELIAVLAVLRPRTYDLSWPRALAMLLLLTPWTLLFALLMVHSGGIMVYHMFWLLGLWLGLATLTTVSAVAELSANRRHNVRLFPKRNASSLPKK